MTHRDTLNPSETPNSCRPMMGDPLDPLRQICNELDASVAAEIAKRARPRHTGIEAAERYLSSHEIPETEPPFPWLYLVAVLAIVAVLVAVCALSWDAIAAGVAFLAMSSAAGSQFFAEAGRDAGVVR